MKKLTRLMVAGVALTTLTLAGCVTPPYHGGGAHKPAVIVVPGGHHGGPVGHGKPGRGGPHKR